MKISIRAIFLSVLLLFAVAAEAAISAQLSENSAINKAGRQRMLTQRIIKSYAQIHLAVQPETSRVQLATAVRLFDAQLIELKSWAKETDVREALGELERHWAPFRATAVRQPDRDGLDRLIAADQALLAAAHQVVMLLEKHSGMVVGRLVNISGRQRMLSQQLAKYYMLRLAGRETAAISDEIKFAQYLFESALDELKAATENSDAINRELQAVALQWEWFRTVLTHGGAQSYALIVANASESIVNSMDLVTAMYEKLPNN